MMRTDLVVVGLGYVGLPLAREAVRAGMVVVGFDKSDEVIASLATGLSHVDDVPDSDVAYMLHEGFVTTKDEVALGQARNVVVCVPTPLAEGGGPDLRAVESAMAAIGRHLQEGMLVVLESTTFPGTTEDVVAPILEAISGLRAGQDFCLAFSPERIDPGNHSFGLRNTPKIVGGLTRECTARARDFYTQLVDEVHTARSCREAETAKLLENTYRHVNIALVNEMARFCHELDIDLWDVIRLASTKPFGFQAFYPGPGVGGHCIPIDPNYLSHTVRSRLGYPFRFVELAEEVNATMPAYVAARAQKILNTDRMPMNGARVLLLGVTYKPNIADQRESPAVDLAAHLTKLGAILNYHDPYVPEWLDGRTCEPDLDKAVASADIVILVQAHSHYDAEGLAAQSVRFFDTRGVTVSSAAVRL